MRNRRRMSLVVAAVLLAAAVAAWVAVRAGAGSTEVLFRSIHHLRSFHRLVQDAEARLTFEGLARRYSLVSLTTETLNEMGQPETDFVHELAFGSRLTGSQQLLRLRIETHLDENDASGESFAVRNAALVWPSMTHVPSTVITSDGVAGFDIIRAMLLDTADAEVEGAFSRLADCLSFHDIYTLTIERNQTLETESWLRIYDVSFYLSELGSSGQALRFRTHYNSKERHVEALEFRSAP